MSMDLKNNVWGSLRTAWQSFARLPVAALPPVDEGETATKRDAEDPQGKKKREKFVLLCVCYSCPGACMPLFSPVVYLVFGANSLTSYYVKPRRQSQLFGERKALIFGLKYWSGQELFIAITSQVSQDNHLA